MTDRPQSDPPSDSLTTLGKAERDAALRRFEALRPHIQHGVALGVRRLRTGTARAGDSAPGNRPGDRGGALSGVQSGT